MLVGNQVSTQTHETQGTEDAVNTNARSTIWNGSMGFNYQHRERMSAGLFYRYTGKPSGFVRFRDNLSVYNSGNLKRTITSYDERNEKTGRHYGNAYFNYNFTKDTYLKLDADYLNGTGDNKQDYAISQEGVYTQTNSHNKLYAARLKFVTPFVGGSIKTGVEGSYTRNRNTYTVLDETTLANELQSSQNVAKQRLFAAFAEYARTFSERWSASVGARFEHVGFDYFSNGVKDDKTSRVSNGVYPSASVAYNGGDVQLSLAYRYTTLRPSYFMLRSAVEYNSPYSYEGGSPYLQPRKTNMLSFSAVWKDLQLEASYSFITNSTMYVVDMYQGSDSITLFHTQNIKKNQVLDIALTYTPTWFKVWHPSFTADITKPYLTYNNKKYNKPIFLFQINNRLDLPHHFILGADASLSTAGNLDTDLSYYYSEFDLGAYCIKSFLNDRLRLKLAIDNALNTSKEKWRKDTNGILLDKWADYDRRTVSFTVTYRFNPSKRKYKGEASTDEINRL